MVVELNDLLGMEVVASDKVVGSLEDFIFGQDYKIKYFVINEGRIVRNRHLLATPEDVKQLDSYMGSIELNITEEKLFQLQENYSLPEKFKSSLTLVRADWPSYWRGGETSNALNTVSVADEIFATHEGDHYHTPVSERESENFHLLLPSYKELIHFKIKDPTDHKLGKVEDFISSTETWTCKYLLIRFRERFKHQKSLITPKLIKEIDNDAEFFYVNIDKETLHSSPVYEKDLSQEFLKRVESFNKNILRGKSTSLAG